MDNLGEDGYEAELQTEAYNLVYGGGWSEGYDIGNIGRPSDGIGENIYSEYGAGGGSNRGVLASIGIYTGAVAKKPP